MKPPNSSSLLTTASQAASAATAEILAGWTQHKNLSISSKGSGDLVTDTDYRAEHAAIAVIQKAFPDHAILAEESGTQGQSDYLWVIDPLDGSLNFAHGIPHFGVSIACLHQGKTILGLITDPLRQETFHALSGSGAWLNDTPIRVSPCTHIQDAVLATVFPKPGSSLMPAYLPTLEYALQHAQAVRRTGAMVLDLAWLAAGRINGFWQTGMAPWDLCAGSLLVTEAGGSFLLPPNQTLLQNTGCLASTPELLPQLQPHLLTPLHP